MKRANVKLWNGPSPDCPWGSATSAPKRTITGATLFAALNYLDGKILARTEKHHTHVEWLRFLKQIERETPNELELHLIADNYATHKHRKVRHWLTRHPRFTIHFTPTGSSWMNLVERFFADLKLWIAYATEASKACGI